MRVALPPPSFLLGQSKNVSDPRESGKEGRKGGAPVGIDLEVSEHHLHSGALHNGASSASARRESGRNDTLQVSARFTIKDTAVPGNMALANLHVACCSSGIVCELASK